MTTEVVRLDRLQTGLRAWVTALFPDITVVWSGEYPRERTTPTYVTLVKIAGPRSAGAGSWSKTTHALPMSATLTVTDATPGRRATLRASGRRFSYKAQAGDDVEAVRDGLLAVIDVGGDPGPMVSATFSARGTDAIEIVGLEAGDLYRLSAQGLASLTIDTTIACKVQLDEVVHTVRLQAYSTSRHPRSGASRVVAKILGSRELDPGIAVLDAYGLDVVPGNPVDLDSMAGPVWESRSAIDLDVSQLSLAAAPGNRITQVRTDLLVRTVLDEITDEVLVS